MRIIQFETLMLLFVTEWSTLLNDNLRIKIWSVFFTGRIWEEFRDIRFIRKTLQKRILSLFVFGYLNALGTIEFSCFNDHELKRWITNQETFLVKKLLFTFWFLKIIGLKLNPILSDNKIWRCNDEKNDYFKLINFEITRTVYNYLERRR